MILVVGLSPAWQRTLAFEHFSPEKVNRAKHVTETASGKGVNVARVARQLGAAVRLVTVAGGRRGDLLTRSLKAQRIDARIVRVKAQTRICQTLLADGTVTELVEEAGAMSQEEVQEVNARFTSEIRTAKLLVLTGTVPRGCGENFYARLIAKARAVGVPALVDAQAKQLANAVKAKPFAVRINHDEFKAVPNLARERVASFVISNGARSISVFHARKTTQFTPPRVKVVNSIGSGDAMLAGIACALWRGKSMAEAVRLGIACGAANAMTPMPGFVRLADVRQLLKRL
jgi:tagatose 6-phosphate kinase